MRDARILLVDDHAVVRAGLRNALESVNGSQVVGELDGGANLKAELARLRPNCLLIDVTMPDFEPISAIAAIRAAYPDLKILVVSAYDDDVYVQGLLRAGVNGYHLKDQPLSDLRLAVERVMNGERWVTGRLLDRLLNPLPRPQLPKLTPRQKDILRLLQLGYDNQTIASEIGISVRTVENHLTRLYRQINVQSRLEAVRFLQDNPELLTATASNQQHPQIPRSGPFAGAGSHSILVVDDNSRFRRQIRRILERTAPTARVREAENSAMAVSACKEEAPRLVFVDVVLGNEDGINCVRRIKSTAGDARIVLMTAYPDKEFHARGLQAGAIALVDKKDLDSAALQQIVADVLR